MKISVIIPVYNVEDYLAQCIESVLMQSYNNLEVLLINDGSTDNSKVICENYAQKYRCIKLINKENGGLSDARNVGILNATGDYLIFIDSDDYWAEDFLYDLVEILINSTTLDFIFFKYKILYQQRNIVVESNIKISRKIRNTDGKTFLEYIFTHNKNFNWYAVLYLINRKFILQNKLFFEKGKHYEDVLWTPQLFLKARKVRFYDKSLYVYRQERSGAITTNLTNKDINDGILISKFWYEELKKRVINNNLKIQLLNNLCTRYFVAIWFSGKFTNIEKNKTVKLLQENRAVLKCGKGIIKKVTALICGVLGFRVCMTLFEYVLLIKQKFTKQKIT
ncbi:glycosyltransferase [Rummeliibacillus sp. TYF005]|uniref:glycosyltransferase n=1 Tax=unclassified Rummeliibacillus TaxID=2622809 RepID=UPI000E65EB7E|nr:MULTISPECIES: glycosyltransferase [unclassified Rummeliibacillus]RIJ63534.1 glycosyltransferase [Rummeliibacillus sp. POC4]RPJ94470.1 glycosyltransferase [Rummeliibacillus sp. TYF005]